MAQRDLAAALQLLAERAQYITGATGAAIALLDGGNMICRASAGSSAPELGAHLQINAGLSGESVRTRQVLRCHDAEIDPRVNRESCRALGIASVVVLPLIREQEVNGVFELMADRVNAFEDRDIAALERLGEMIQTAIDHAEAAKRAQREIAGGVEVPAQKENVAEEETILFVDDNPIDENSNRKYRPAKHTPITFRPVASQQEDANTADAEPQLLAGEPAAVRQCSSCGFPVSGTRSLCLDCENAQASGVTVAIASGHASDFLSQFNSDQPRESWLRSNLFIVAAFLVVVGTVALLLWHRM
jgi:putative methionine-R-sulfoxide reductase with GAF domain